MAVGLAIIGLALFSLANWAGIALVIVAGGVDVVLICTGFGSSLSLGGKAFLRGYLPK